MAPQQRIALDVARMDDAHNALFDLLDSLQGADDAQLTAQFESIRTHLAEHFADEEALMTEVRFSAFAEHHGEHQRLLGETAMLARFAKRGGQGAIGDFVRNRLPGWLTLHIQTMDAALAAQARAS
ncbi:bacteriohemerythrin [Magnetofaba australis]|uniref:Putative hemerythrin-like metal-binding protein n=1 Tax=Magnetofaba australis IT-1 TaxID=1434232 RepID=A0A1Y2K5E5_9PROT|nr:hemerythrin family protein [Magnetofaba australis]OSM02215.1 putative hemerythrin-like metal-binding protein [Magnetofaba australis IT-1]